MRKIIFQTLMFSCLSICVCASKFKRWANSPGTSRAPDPAARHCRKCGGGGGRPRHLDRRRFALGTLRQGRSNIACQASRELGGISQGFGQVILVHVDCEHLSTIYSTISSTTIQHGNPVKIREVLSNTQ